MIAHAVRLDLRFALSFRDVEELLAERGIQVSYETVRLGGALHWLWRAVDDHGHTLDVLLQERRDTAAAERFFRRLLTATHGIPPARITTDKLGSYAAAKAGLREFDRVEQAHQPTRVRERGMRRFKSVKSAQRFLDAFSRVGNLFRPGRHRLGAAAYRAIMRERVATWHEVVGLRVA